ncbi:MAG TPA: potassium transporter TrkG [Paracoccaceae bacterium]|nr:potassium transporter TrkG [Paracoccaceae bacterium]
MAFGYLSYMLVGWGLLALPVAQAVPVGALDALFIAVSAVSTTGLVTIDPGSSFTFWGEAAILLMMQLGGLGYMTVGSFAYLSFQNRLAGVRARGARAAFNLPATLNVGQFLRAVVLFTLGAEAVGTLLLWPMFAAAGVPDPLWAALFHAVSAFCTAGFSLFATGFEPFVAHPGIVAVISALSILGAMGFLIVVDAVQRLVGQERRVGFSARIILILTAGLIGLGTLYLALFEPSIAARPGAERWMAAFFQAMTASTTVGFNTVPIGAVGGAGLMMLMVLMLVGASPAGTGGGLKTTTFAVLFAQMWSVLRRREGTVLMGRSLTGDRLQMAAAALLTYLALMTVALFVLVVTEAGARFDVLLFEVISAMSTVGLSMGLTGGLSDAGKAVIILLMYAGRVGLLSFGIAFALRAAAPEEDRRADVVL